MAACRGASENPLTTVKTFDGPGLIPAHPLYLRPRAASAIGEQTKADARVSFHAAVELEKRRDAPSDGGEGAESVATRDSGGFVARVRNEAGAYRLLRTPALGGGNATEAPGVFRPGIVKTV